MMRPELTIDNYLCNFDITEGLVTSAKHIVATCKIIESACSLYIFNSQHALSNLSSFQETSRC